MTMTVKIEGLRELDDALGELPKAVARGVLRRVGLKALEPVATTAIRLAPDDPETVGDDLKANIGVGTKLSGRQARIARRDAQRGLSDQSFVEVYAGVSAHSKTPQGVQQEFGNVNHPPQSFMRPAWEQHKHGVLDTIAADLGDEITKAAQRAERRAARRAARGL